MKSTLRYLFTAALVACLSPQASGQERSPRHVAGIDYGTSDGIGAEARLSTIGGLVVEGDHLFIAQAGHPYSVRRLDLGTGEVTTLKSGPSAPLDAPITGIAADGRGSLYLTFSSFNYRGVKRLDEETAVVAHLAGASGLGGPNSGASIDSAHGLVWEAGALFVVSGYAVHRVEVPSGRATTLAGGEQEASGYRDGRVELALFRFPAAIAGDGRGNLYIADAGNYVVRRIELATGMVTTIAGTPGVPGLLDDVGPKARFRTLSGIAVDPAGNVFITERNDGVVRRIDAITRRVTTIAGTSGAIGNHDGPFPTARFADPSPIAADRQGNVYVGDNATWTIRRIDPLGNVSTVVGLESRVIPQGPVRSRGDLFRAAGLAADAQGLFVLDSLGHAVRKILEPSGEIASIAGSGVPGDADGSGLAASFMAEDTLRSDGTFLYSQQQGRLRRISPRTGLVVTLPAHVGARFIIHKGRALWVEPDGIVRGVELATGLPVTMPFANGGLYRLASGAGNDLYALQSAPPLAELVRLDVESGARTVVATGVSGVAEMCFDGDRSLYMLGQQTGRVRRFDLGTATATEVATVPGRPTQLACGANGRVFVAAEAVFELPTPIQDVATVDIGFGPVGTPRTFVPSPRTADTHRFRLSRRPSRSAATLRDLSSSGVVLTPDVADVFEVELVATTEGGAYRRSVAATFSPETRCVSASFSVVPPAAGSITVSPPAGCSAGQVPVGRVVPLAVEGSPGFAFLGWANRAGERYTLGSFMQTSTELVAMGDLELEARFVEEARCHPVTVSGARRSDPGNCRVVSYIGYVEGTTVNLVASSPGTFAYWTATGATIAQPDQPVSSFVAQGPATIRAVHASNPPSVEPRAYFYTVRPCRLVDSRERGPASLAGERRGHAFKDVCGIPVNAVALSVNVTALDATGSGDLRVYATGSPVPAPPLVPVQIGRTRAVGAFLRVTKDALDALDIVVETGNGSGSVNYLIDVNGYWQWRP